MQCTSLYSKQCLSSSSHRSVITLKLQLLFSTKHNQLVFNESLQFVLKENKNTVLSDNSVIFKQSSFLFYSSFRAQLCCARTLLTLQCTWRWVSNPVKGTHRPHLYKTPACNRWVINSFYIFPPRKALRTWCTSLWHSDTKQQGGPRALKKLAHVHFQLLVETAPLIRAHLERWELKGSTIYRNLKSLETIQRILLTNNTKSSMHLFFLSVVLNTSHRDCWLRVKKVSKVLLCSKCIPDGSVGTNAGRWHSSTYTCIHMAQFQFDTRLLNPFLFLLIGNKYRQLKDCKELPDPTKPTRCTWRNPSGVLTGRRALAGSKMPGGLFFCLFV